MSSSPEPLKTRRVGQRCTLNLSRAETSSRWCACSKSSDTFSRTQGLTRQRRFRRGTESVKDDESSGRPKTSRTAENIEIFLWRYLHTRYENVLIETALESNMEATPNQQKTLNLDKPLYQLRNSANTSSFQHRVVRKEIPVVVKVSFSNVTCQAESLRYRTCLSGGHKRLRAPDDGLPSAHPSGRETSTLPY
ncbi:hypothetical protein TNCV_52941 [Trichonephila clavipes]|nr:hypothetical protein TNCV_52941 [Trichonephila clavipes]